MKQLKFIGKSAPFRGQLERTVQDFIHLEVQLLEDNMTCTVNELFKTIKDSGADPCVVHNVIKHNTIFDDTSIETILGVGYDLITKTFNLAQLIAEDKKESIPVVVHFISPFEKWHSYTYVYTEFCRRIHQILRENPQTVICFENYVPFSLKLDVENNVSGFYHYGGCDLDNIKLAKQLQRDLPDVAHQIGVTLDTCHIMMTQYFAKTVGYAGTVPSIKDYFREARELCRVVHLNNMNGDGQLGTNHSAAFLEEDMSKLEEILNLISEYAPQAYITLEQNEEDYEGDPTRNKRITYTTIQEIFRKNALKTQVFDKGNR